MDSDIIRIFLSLVAFTCTVKTSSIFFQAVAQPAFAVATSLIRDIVCFIPLVCILPVFYGVDGILFAAPASDLIAVTVAAVLTAVFFRKLNQQANAKTPHKELGEASALRG
ncbi:MAG: hypothetical protein ACI4NG_02695 [Candidatus Gallimonas sp.]